MPPHLLVVRARNSCDPGPVRLRQEAKRGGRWRRRRDRGRDRAAIAVACDFLTPPGLRGTKSQKFGRSWRRKFNRQKATGGAASKATSQRMPYALVKIAYGGRNGTHGTAPARRGDIGEDAGGKRSPSQGRFSGPCKTTWPSNFPTGGGVLGQEAAVEMAHRDPHRPPDSGSTAKNS
jgi:hypothetical protein